MKKIFVVLAAIFILGVIACSGGGGSSSDGASGSTLTATQIKEIESASGEISNKIQTSSDSNISKTLEEAKATALAQPSVESAEIIDGQLAVKYKGAGDEVWILNTGIYASSGKSSYTKAESENDILSQLNSIKKLTKGSTGTNNAVIINALSGDSGFAPYNDIFNDITTILTAKGYNVRYLNGREASRANMKTLSDCSVIIMLGHGGVMVMKDQDYNQFLDTWPYGVMIGEEWNDDWKNDKDNHWGNRQYFKVNVPWGSGSDCEGERKNTTKSFYALTGQFWKDTYAKSHFNNALFINLACSAGKYKMYRDDLFSVGVSAYTGWDNITDYVIAGTHAKVMLTKMAQGKTFKEAIDDLYKSGKHDDCITQKDINTNLYYGPESGYSLTLQSNGSISSAKAITAFSLNGVVGTINEAGKTIAVTMPSGTAVTNLVATFTTTGASVKVGSTVQVSGTTANNFTSPVVYTVTAADATTQNYTVTVTVAAAGTYSMSGTIHVGSNSGAVLTGATVSIAGLTATTGSAGTFTITGIPAGTYAFSVSKSGYDTYTNSAYYVGSNQTALSFYLTQSSTSGDYTSANIGTLKYVPAGSFQRDATSTNISTVSAFRMSQYEITRAQFLAVMGVDPSYTTSSTGTSDPVQMVTWYDAVEFCNKLSIAEGLTPVYTITGRTPATGYPITDASVTPTWANNGYRLPTEMEWMWAAMGATAGATGYLKAFAGSTGSNAIGDYAWYSGNSASTTHPVGTKLPNELWIYDMSGNVWEWCWDWYDAYPTGTQTNYRGAAPGSIRVVRGGGWGTLASYATVATRSNASGPGRRDADDLGFRVVRP